jgi:8-oxo-dGTP diphosphatase
MTTHLIVAAGAVLYKEVNGEFLFALIHRPNYDDWTFPKGKVDKNESIEDCAIREVFEETGFKVTLGPKLNNQNYVINGRKKIVYYWLSQVIVNTKFIINDEVDELVWLNKTNAFNKLSYPADRLSLEEAVTNLGSK